MLEKVGIPCPRCDKRFLSPLVAVSHLLNDHPHKIGWRQPSGKSMPDSKGCEHVRTRVVYEQRPRGEGRVFRGVGRKCDLCGELLPSRKAIA